jgi:S1-C subfamily serine protease
MESKIMQKIINFTLLFCLLFALAQQVESQSKKRPTKIDEPKNLTAEQIAKKYLPSVVLIVCDDGQGAYSQGSGFFIREGVILTNHHVIEGMKRGKAKIALDNNKAKEWWIEKVLYTDEKKDLALLSITETDKTKIPILNLSATGKTNIGESIYVLSNPKGLAGTISQGIVSSEIRKTKDVELLQIDAPISSGSSGGAVLNARGEVIGIATASLSSGQNLNFAVPSFQIKNFLAKYDDISLNEKYSFFEYKEILNSWKLGRIPIKPVVVSSVNTQENTIPKTEKELTFEERSRRLTQIIQNTSISTKDTSYQTDNFGISQCNAEFIAKFTNLDNSGGWNTSYKFNLKNVSNIEMGTNKFGWNIILVEFTRKISEVTTYSGGNIDAVLTETVVIPVEKEDKVILAWLDFNVLKNACAKDSSNIPVEKPTLKETTDWLVDKIEGTSFFSDGVTTKYEKLGFSQCKINLIEKSTNRGINFIDTSETDLRFLKSVGFGKNGLGYWSIWLEFNQNFIVKKEMIGYTREKETSKDDKITIFISSYDNGKSVFSAFTRMLELCSEKSKELF